MKKLSSVFGIVLVASTSWAHLPVGEVFPAVQFPDDKVPTVDGNLADWESIPDAYWINHEQLTETVRGVGTAWDATDLALRAIVGWNPTTNKLYVMEDRFDDAVWVTTGWEPMEMVFDADHSGGMFNVWPDVEDQDQKDLLHEPGLRLPVHGVARGRVRVRAPEDVPPHRRVGACVPVWKSTPSGRRSYGGT